MRFVVAVSLDPSGARVVNRESARQIQTSNTRFRADPRWLSEMRSQTPWGFDSCRKTLGINTNRVLASITFNSSITYCCKMPSACGRHFSLFRNDDARLCRTFGEFTRQWRGR